MADTDMVSDMVRLSRLTIRTVVAQARIIETEHPAAAHVLRLLAREHKKMLVDVGEEDTGVFRKVLEPTSHPAREIPLAKADER